MKQGKYTVNEVEERTSVAAGTLRQWERRYGFPKPERTDSGYRLYSDEDLNSIEAMKRHMANGVPASRAAELVQAPLSAPDLPRPSTDLSRELVAAFVDFDERRAEQVLSEAHALFPVERVVQETIKGAMVELGERWHRGEVDTTTEHFASSFVMGRLRMLMSMTGTGQGALEVIVTCAPHDRHEMGALMLAVLLRRAGYRVYYLGADTPLVDLAAMAADKHPLAVMISASDSEAIRELKRGSNHLNDLAPLLIFGGRAFDTEPAEAGVLGGLYLSSDASQAVTEFDRLVRDVQLSQA